MFCPAGEFVASLPKPLYNGNRIYPENRHGLPMSDLASRSSDPAFRAKLRLALVSGVGPRISQTLLDWFGAPEAILAATRSQLEQVSGVGPKLSRKIVEAGEIDIDRELSLCLDFGVDVLTLDDERYPHLLTEIPDPPSILFLRGDLLPADALSVAIVGTRHASSYGLAQAERFGFELAKAGFTVVSGLARGIDGAAHRGALRAGGRTVAYLASGLRSIYPPEHETLADEVAEQGALLSESPPLAKPLSGAFPQRNRLITGMSLGVIVVEAATRSGALISARCAMEQGREVFAIPGRIDNANARGCHRLLKDGAKLVESIDDVLDELGPLARPAKTEDGKTIHLPAEMQLNEMETAIMQALADGQPADMDAVVSRSGLPIQNVLSTICVLEMRRLVRRLSGVSVQRAV